MTEAPPPLVHTIFMLIKTTSTWLALQPRERFAFLDEKIRPILAAHPTVRMRFFDAEAYTARASDIMMWETGDLAAYQAVVEELRETSFWGAYFDVLDILPAVENAYANHYNVKPV